MLTEESITLLIHFAVIIMAVFVASYIRRILAELKQAKRTLSVFKSLDGRVGVCDRRGNLYFLHTENENINKRGLKHIKEIKNIDYKKIMASITTVFNTRTPLTLDYEYNSTKRAMTISPLDEKIMGQECVVWFSHDNTELHDARTQAEHFAEQNCRNLTKLRQATKLLDIVINALPIQIFAKDANDNFKYIFANKKFREFIGKEESEIIGNTDFDLYPDFLAQQMRSEDSLNLENLDEGIESVREAKSANGTFHKLRVITYPFQDGTGRLLLLGAIVDVTEVENLIKNERLTKLALEQTVLEGDFTENVDKLLPIIRANLNCDYVAVSKKDESTDDFVPVAYLTTADDFSPQAITDFLKTATTSDSPENFCAYNASENSENPIKVGYSAPVEIGGNLWGVLSVGWFENIEDLADENKQLLESMANIVALSNIRHIQNLELIKSIEEKNKATQNKSFFIASLSHKVRTSLNAIIGLVDLMRDKNSSEEYADSIANACNGLSQILGNALDYSKIEADTFQLSKEHVKITECVELTLSSFAKKAHEKGIAFEVDFNGIPDLILDKQRFARTISNLAENAVANTQEGWVRLSAKFEKTSDSQGILSIQADDTGRGISDDNLEKIFEPFGGSNPSENIENAGLGLPLIKIFVEKYGGTIDISRRETGGTSVKIVIPNIALALEETEMPKPVSSEKKVSSLLLVDDVDMNLRVMTALCKKVGVEKIITATSAKKALEILAENTFDAVITDMWMPEINGDKLAEKIREMPSAKDTAIIGLTADIDASDKFDPKYFDAMLIKPINAPTLQKIFQNVSALGSQMLRADTDS